jgi:hypothetical protein
MKPALSAIPSRWACSWRSLSLSQAQVGELYRFVDWGILR